MATGRVSTTFKDAGGFVASTDVYVSVPAGGTIANLQSELGALANLINNVTDCVVTGMKYHIDVDVSGLTPNTPTGSQSLDNALALKFPNHTNTRPWDMIIPGVAAAVLSGGRPVDSEGSAIDLLSDVLEVNMTTAGLTAGFYANNQLQALAPTAGAFRTNRKLARKLPSRTATVGS